jgi:FkbM family methyltransferase
MTKTLAIFMNALLRALTALLPRWKRLTVRARLYDGLQPFEDVKVGGNRLKLFIPDRTCVYWAKEGPGSEPATNAWVNSFTGSDTFVDIGANIGLYSLMAAANGVSRVYAIEPNPFSFSVLARNIVANGFGSVIIPLCLAMSNRSSIVTFKLGGPHAGTIKNEIIGEEPHPDGMSITTASFSMDELFRVQGISGINHLKIDVDGLELEILRGASGLLSDKALKSVLVEDNSKNEREESELVSFLGQFDFSLTNAWGRDGTDNKIFIRK